MANTPPTGDRLLSRRTLLQQAAVGGAVLSTLGWPESRAAYAADSPSGDRLTPDAAWQRLLEGNRRYVDGKPQAPRRDAARRADVAETQKPFAAFLSCADSRVPLEIIFDEGIGDLFVVRDAGNITTPEVIASLEFGTLVLGAAVLVVVGHTGCGAVKAAMAGDAVPGQISTLYQHIMPAVDRGGKDLDAVTRANVEIQARTLRQASPVIAGLVRDGKLAVRGVVYDIRSGRLAPVEV
jgi:carbonic anhydrase